MAKYRWKFLYDCSGKMVSRHNDETWKIGEWKKLSGGIILCASGFHCSKKVSHAFSYIPGEVVAKVEVRGQSDIGNDKEAYSEMRIVRAYEWTKTDSVKLAIFAAEQVIEVYEKEYPRDDRPRKAIEAAKAYLKYPTGATTHAVANAIYAATNAAANAAATAAAAAGNAALAALAAYVAATATNAIYAATNAALATNAATNAAMFNRIDKWMTDHIKELKEINDYQA